jgi:hypothetical protein
MSTLTRHLAELHPNLDPIDVVDHPPIAPGRRTLTMGLPARPASERGAPAETGSRAPRESSDEAHDAMLRQVLDAAFRPDLCTLPDDVRTQMERSFGADFSDVEVNAASPLASSIGAQAVTDGRALHFAPGEYDPHSLAGRELIGHELAHVVQQRQGRVDAALQRYSPGATDTLEREADEMGARAARGESAMMATSATGAAHDPTTPVELGLAAPNMLLQRRLQAKFAVQIERGVDTKIRSLHFSGRSDSPFKKSMGAHTTAWVVHCDHVRRVIIGCTLAEAIPQLRGLMAELDAMASWTWAATDWTNGSDKAGDGEAKKRFRTSRDAMSAKLTAFGTAGNEEAKVSIIQRAIAMYLEARNYMPLATIDNKKTKGNTEGVHRGNLLAVNPDDDAMGQGVELAWQLFDAGACAFAASKDDEAKIPGSTGIGKDERVARALAAHAHSIKSAYPRIIGAGKLLDFLEVGAGLVKEKCGTIGAVNALAARAKVLHDGLPTTAHKADALRGDQSTAAEVVVANGTFSAINAGRPDSPYSTTQGAHTTAWIVHEDALNTAIGAGKHGDANRAAKGVLDAIDELDKSPLSTWVKNLPMSREAARELLPLTGGEIHAEARIALDAGAKALREAYAKDAASLEQVQHVARLLLQVENLYPMATTASGGTNPGHGEGSLRDVTDEEFEATVWTNLDLGTSTEAIEEHYEHKRSWDSRLLGVDPDSTYESRFAHMIAQHLFYVKAANPTEYAKVNWYKSIKEFVEEDHRGAAGIAAYACDLVGEAHPKVDLPETSLAAQQKATKKDVEFEVQSQAYNEDSQDYNPDMLSELQDIRKKAAEEKEKKRAHSSDSSESSDEERKPPKAKRGRRGVGGGGRGGGRAGATAGRGGAAGRGGGTTGRGGGTTAGRAGRGGGRGNRGGGRGNRGGSTRGGSSTGGVHKPNTRGKKGRGRGNTH